MSSNMLSLWGHVTGRDIAFKVKLNLDNDIDDMVDIIRERYSGDPLLARRQLKIYKLGDENGIPVFTPDTCLTVLDHQQNDYAVSLLGGSDYIHEYWQNQPSLKKRVHFVVEPWPTGSEGVVQNRPKRIREIGPVNLQTDHHIPFDCLPWFQDLRERCFGGDVTILSGAPQSGKTGAVLAINDRLRAKCQPVYLDMATCCSAAGAITDIVSSTPPDQHVNTFFKWFLETLLNITYNNSSTLDITAFIQFLQSSIELTQRPGYGLVIDHYDSFNTLMSRNPLSPLVFIFQTLASCIGNMQSSSRPIKYMVVVGSLLLDSHDAAYALSCPGTNFDSADAPVLSREDSESLQRRLELVASGNPFNKVARIRTRPPNDQIAHRYIQEYFKGEGLTIDAEVCDQMIYTTGKSLGILNSITRIIATDTRAQLNRHCHAAAMDHSHMDLIRRELIKVPRIRSTLDRIAEFLAPPPQRPGNPQIQTVLTTVFQWGTFRVENPDVGGYRPACQYLHAHGVLAPVSESNSYHGDYYRFWPPCMQGFVRLRLSPVLNEMPVVDVRRA